MVCFYSHLKDDNPGISNVVKVDGSFVGVAVPSVAPGVVLIPVDTQPGHTHAAIGQRLRAQAQRLAIQGVIFVQTARPASFAACWDIRTGHDAIVNWQGADEGPLVVFVSHVVGPRQADACSAGSVKGEAGEYSTLVKTKFVSIACWKQETISKTQFTKSSIMY